ncbi:MAG: hypothetical protein Q9213_007142 [Squamulea squamosa]
MTTQLSSAKSDSMTSRSEAKEEDLTYLVYYSANGETSGPIDRAYWHNDAAIDYAEDKLGKSRTSNKMQYYLKDGLWKLKDDANTACCMIQRWCVNRDTAWGPSDPNTLDLPVAEGYRNDEARIGDTAVLVGHYVAIGERSEDTFEPNMAFTMTNYLRIVNMEKETQSRRGKNRMQESDRKSVWRFK